MRLLTRYILRAHLGPFLFALSALTGLLLVNTVARRFEELAGKGLPLSVVTEVFVLSLPHIVALTLPMAVLVAVLYAFSQLAADNEISAMKASGVNLQRPVLPVLAIAVGLAVLMTWFNDRILPETNHQLKNLLVDIGRKSPTFELKEQVINPIRTGDMRTQYFLQASRIDRGTNRLWDVVIYDLSTPERDRTIYADSGHMAFNVDETDLHLTLYEGFIHEVNPRESDTFQRMFFQQQLFRVPGVGDELERTLQAHRSDREMSIAMLTEEVQRWRAELARVRSDAVKEARNALEHALEGRAMWDNASAAYAIRRSEVLAEDFSRATGTELRSMESRERLFQQRVNQYSVEIHKKYAIPFACIVFVLIGPALAVRFPRGGVGMVIAVSLTIFTVYYVSLIGGESLGDRGIVPPFWAMWAPNVIFLGLGLWAMARLGREDSATRSGGWSELWASLRESLPRPFSRAGAEASP